MEGQILENQLKQILSPEDILFHEPMKTYTTFRVGGPARYFVSPSSEKELADVIALCKKTDTPYLVLGRGSNLLVSDEGFAGVVISMRKHFNQISVDEQAGIITAQAGVSMHAAALAALEAGLGGFEFASGIPGTIGGGILMNAGAYGGEMCEVLLDVRALTKEGEIVTIPVSEAEMGYRTSCFLHSGMVVLSCRMKFGKEEKEAICAKMNELNKRRREKQPLEFGSAGSTFKRPQGYFAGKLIEEVGLKGYSIGDAQVSEKHAGFVINRGKASAEQIYNLCREVQNRVFERFGVKLELEVQLAGRFTKDGKA